MGGAQRVRGGRVLVQLLTDWEVHSLWWFVADAAVMVPETRISLRRSFGWCAEYAWGGVAVQAGLTHGYLHRLAILYDDRVRPVAERLRGGRWAWRRVLTAAPCPLGGSKPRGGSRSAPQEVLRRGRNPAPMDALVAASDGRWAAWRCGVCDGSGFPWRCRPHLLAVLAAGEALDLARTGAEEMAAFLGAIGWCSSFAPVLAAYGAD
jgi:hypothetical protein